MEAVSVTVGDVFWMDVPYTDFSKMKRRPVVVLAKVTHGDVIICAMTSGSYRTQFKVKITPQDFQHDGLKSAGYAQTDKLFTINPTIFDGKIGGLNSATMQKVWQKLSDIFPQVTNQ